MSTASAQVGAFPFSISTSKDAALYVPAVATGSHTARVSGNFGSGAVLTELYDATPASALNLATPRLTNLSVLKMVGSGLTAGFIVRGEGTATVLIRAVGPSLAAFGLSRFLADPKLELFDGQSRSIAINDIWADTASRRYSAYDVFRAASAHVGAFDISGGVSKDAALLVRLAPGSYTVQVKSADGGEGWVLMEVYAAP